MEALGYLVAAAVAVLIIAAPFVSIINAVRSARAHRALRDEMNLLQREVGRLRGELHEATSGAEARHAPAAPHPAPQSAPSAAAAPAVEPEAPPPPHAIPMPVTPLAHLAPSSSAPSRADQFIESFHRSTLQGRPPSHEAVEPAQGVAAAPSVKPTMPPPPSAPPAPKFDWETLLGVRGMAWVGAIALAFAGVLTAKLTIEMGYFMPPMRFATLLVAGAGALVGAQLVLRKGYETTANALCGAGVAVLYVGLFAGHALWNLVGLGPTFALMALVTVVAGLLAIRHNAPFIAVLGLLGGFATPLVLSTAEDRPAGLFSYILLLNLGILWIAVRKGWNALALLAMAGTFLVETLWSARFLRPEKLATGLVIYAVFAALYLGLPRVAREPDRRLMLRASIAGGLMPFIFAFYVAGDPRYAGSWPLLFGFIALLGVGLTLVALWRAQGFLMLAAAIAGVISILLWGRHGFNLDTRWGASLSALGIGLALNYLPRLASLRYAGESMAAGVSWLRGPVPDEELERSERKIRDAAGIIFGAGLLIVAVQLVRTPFLGESPGVFLCLVAGASLIAFERSRRSFSERHVAALGPLAVAIVVQIWFFTSTQSDTLSRNLAMAILLAVVWTAIAQVRLARRPEPDLDPATADAHGLGAALTILIPIATLFRVNDSPDLSASVGQVFAALAALSMLLVVMAMRGRNWIPLLLVGVLAAGARAHLINVVMRLPSQPFPQWEERLAIYGAFYVAWLALPFAMPRRLVPAWVRSPWPWLASALAGPSLFYPIYQVTVAGFGKSYIGALPVAMAALSLAGLAEVRRRYVPTDDPVLARQRLRNLALFAAVALGFLSVAVPLQLDRQWITLGWALEGAAVWWLYRRLPHPGLKYFGFVLFIAIGVRLLGNRAIFTYEERGWPILNWILYTYGIAAACCLVGAALLRPVEEERLTPGEVQFLATVRLAPVVGFLGLILIFALINLEITDYFSEGQYMKIVWTRRYERDLTTSVAWGVYGLILLIIGMWRRQPALRYISLGFLILTIGKVFLFDLSSLAGIYRIFSFLGLAVSLIIVSLLYQRFVFRKGPRDASGNVPDAT